MDETVDVGVVSVNGTSFMAFAGTVSAPSVLSILLTTNDAVTLRLE